MSAYDMDSLLNKWERGTITTEQAVGQILLLIQEVSQRVGSLEKRLEQRRRTGRLELVEQGRVAVEKGEEEVGERPSTSPLSINEEAPPNASEASQTETGSA